MASFKGLFNSSQTVDLKTIIDQGAFLVDVREPGEFKSGSVFGAVNIPLGSLTRELEQFKGKKNIVVFCRSGNRSGQAKDILERNGFKNAVNGGTWENVSQFIK